MPCATKIVATLGPASSNPEVLERLLRAGVDVVRLNFSHGSAEDHIERAQRVRDAAARVGKPVALMADLQGPKIRVGRFAEGSVTLAEGAAFVLDAARGTPGDLQGVTGARTSWFYAASIAVPLLFVVCLGRFRALRRRGGHTG